MKKIPLPLSNEFFSIIENHEIINWESKDFWEKMNHSLYTDKQKMRKRMYAGIRVLTICKFFEIKKSPNNNRVNIYTENQRLKSFRSDLIQNRLKDVLSKKHNQILEDIKIKENELNFIQLLSIENPSIKNHLDKYNKKYENDMDFLKSNIKVIEKILDNRS